MKSHSSAKAKERQQRKVRHKVRRKRRTLWREMKRRLEKRQKPLITSTAVRSPAVMVQPERAVTGPTHATRLNSTQALIDQSLSLNDLSQQPLGFRSVARLASMKAAVGKSQSARQHRLTLNQALQRAHADASPSTLNNRVQQPSPRLHRLIPLSAPSLLLNAEKPLQTQVIITHAAEPSRPTRRLFDPTLPHSPRPVEKQPPIISGGPLPVVAPEKLVASRKLVPVAAPEKTEEASSDTSKSHQRDRIFSIEVIKQARRDIAPSKKRKAPYLLECPSPAKRAKLISSANEDAYLITEPLSTISPEVVILWPQPPIISEDPLPVVASERPVISRKLESIELYCDARINRDIDRFKKRKASYLLESPSAAKRAKLTSPGNADTHLITESLSAISKADNKRPQRASFNTDGVVPALDSRGALFLSKTVATKVESEKAKKSLSINNIVADQKYLDSLGKEMEKNLPDKLKPLPPELIREPSLETPEDLLFLLDVIENFVPSTPFWLESIREQRGIIHTFMAANKVEQGMAAFPKLAEKNATDNLQSTTSANLGFDGPIRSQ